MRKRMLSVLNIIIVLGFLGSFGGIPVVAHNSQDDQPFMSSTQLSLYLPVVLKHAGDPPLIIPDTTSILTEDTTQFLSEISGDGVVYTFSESTPELDSLDIGDVMVGDITTVAPNGFLRKLTNVSRQGEQVVVETEQAVLEEAIQSGSVQINHTLSPDDIQDSVMVDGVSLAPMPYALEAAVFSISIDDVILYDDDGDAKTTNDQITANGSITLESSFQFKTNIRGFQVESLKFTSSVTETADLTIQSQVEYPLVQYKEEVARHYFTPITVPVGVPPFVFPVVFVPVLTVHVGVDGSVHVGVSTGATQQATLTAGVRYDDSEWSPIHDFTNDFLYTPPTLSAGLDFKAYAGMQISLMLYGVVGPHLEVNAYIKLEADILAVPWWQLYGGLEVPVGIEIEVLSHVIASYQTTVIDFRILLLQANIPPNEPSMPFPTDDAMDQSIEVDLSWSGWDPDGDTVTYDVYFEKDNPTPIELISPDQPRICYNLGTLDLNTHYYWRIVARDEHNVITEGPVWDFTTGSEDITRSWQEVGYGSASCGGISNSEFSTDIASVAIAPDNSPYVAWGDYRGGENPFDFLGDIFIKRWNGSSWEEVGSGSATGGGISNSSKQSISPAIAVAPGGTPYVVWNDYSDDDVGQIYVRRWNGSSWEEVGAGSASGGGISYDYGGSGNPSIAIAPDGTPYIAWDDSINEESEIYVRRWNGSNWEEVGTGSASGGGISNNSGQSWSPSVAIAPDGTPYIAWEDNSSGDYEIYIRRWNGSIWEEIGAASASGGGISNNCCMSESPSIAIAPDGTLYVAWDDLGSGGETDIYVRRWNGGIWEEVGTGSASGGGISNNSSYSTRPSMAIAPDGTPYIAWDNYNYSADEDSEIYIRRWNGSSWEEVGSGSASGGGISYDYDGSGNPSIAIASYGTTYVVWHDTSLHNLHSEIYIRRWVE